MEKAKFIHLHVHSHYSLLDGLTKIPDLIKKAQEYEMPALALTDHGNMYGAIEFYTAAKKAGIKPIIGCEVYIAPRRMQDKQPKIDTRPYHLVLLAKNMEGYKNLIKLVSRSYLEGYYYKPRIDKDLLKHYSGGLVAMSACLNGEIPRLIMSQKKDRAKELIKYYQSLFGKEDFYLEVQFHPKLEQQRIVNKVIFELAKETGTEVVLTNDSHYLNEEDSRAHEVLLSVQTGKDFDDKNRLSMTSINASFYSPEYAQQIMKNHPEVLANTLKIAEKCNLELELGKNILPKFELPEGEKDSFTYLKKLTYVGFRERYPKQTNEEKKRLDYELGVIEKTGFADYFLIVQDFINWAKSQGIIVGPGRGSAAGSMAAYCLRITDLEPLKQNLLFERFLNPERISMPDIDIDFADDRRGEVIKYVQGKYGVDHVAQIITFGTMAARGSIRDTGRALGISYSDVDRVAKLIPMGMNLHEALEESTEFRSLYQTDESVKDLIDMAMKLEGVARHASTHACGVVISKLPLTEYLPLQQATKGETSITTQYSMKYVEAIGLLKMDFLGLANLTIIKNALRIIKKIRNVDIDISKLPFDDKKTYELLARAETTGVFQLESSGMKRYLKQLKPTVFDDIVAMVALYRPGPMELIPDYIDRKHGKKKVEYLHPLLEPILKSTYGIAVYQEQLMQIARSLANFSLGEADVLRKAVGKKIMALLQEQKQKLIDGMVKNKIKKEVAIKIWQFVEPFAAYGFNKSHAACYALIAYQTAYLKAHYPKEFMAALLTSDFGNLDRIAIEISECKKMGIEVRPPDVNQSFVEFGVVPDKKIILFGLEAIKNVGVKVAEEIVKDREKYGKFKSLEDFVSRLGPTVVNKKTVEALAKSGGFDSFHERNKILFGVEAITRFASALGKNKATGQTSLFFDTKSAEELMQLNLPDVEPADKKQRLSWERDHLGIYLSEHPLDDFKEIIKRLDTKKIVEISPTANQVKIAGVISTMQKIVTKRKENMVFANIEDDSGKIEALVFPKTLAADPLVWQLDNVVGIRGKINNKDGVLKIIVEKVKNLADVENNVIKKRTNQNLEIKLQQETSKETLAEIKKTLEKFPGEKEVILHVPHLGTFRTINLKQKISLCDELFIELEEIDGIKVI